MADDKTALTGEAVLEEGLDGLALGARQAGRRFETGNFNAGAALVTQIAEAADEANHHPDVDLRYPHVTVSLMSHDVEAITQRDVRLARRISELAAAAGIAADPGARRPRARPGHPGPRSAEALLRARCSVTSRTRTTTTTSSTAPTARPSMWFQTSDSAGAGPAALAPRRQRPARRGRGAAAGGARRGRHARRRRAGAGFLGGRGRGRQPVLHLHLAGPSRRSGRWGLSGR